jgi:hypothetical protein
VLLTVGILWNPEPFGFLRDRMTTRVLLWPVSVLLALGGPGPKLGTGYEWTSVHDVAVAVGVGLSWLFWVSVGAGLWLAPGHRRIGVSALAGSKSDSLGSRCDHDAPRLERSAFDGRR